MLTYKSSGFSAVNMRISYAEDANGQPSTWTAWPNGDLATGGALPLTSTSSGTITVFGYHPWVGAQLLSKTGTGVITGQIDGWRRPVEQNVNCVAGCAGGTQDADENSVAAGALQL